jgi:hypothetical protein
MHALRDPEAALYIGDVLQERGFRYGGLIPDRRDMPLDLRLFRSDDLILLTTRPPLHDIEDGSRKSVEEGFTVLESTIFRNVFGRWFKRYSRTEIQLTDAAIRAAPGIRTRQEMMIRPLDPPVVHAYASLVDGRMVWRRFSRAEAPSVAFVVYSEHAWGDGPAVLAVWSVAGTPTLVWSAKIAADHRDLLLTTPFVMAELQLRVPSAAPPVSMAFADAWMATILGVA